MQDGPGNLANKTLKTEKKTRMKDKSRGKEETTEGEEKRSKERKKQARKNARHRNKVIKNDTIVNKRQTKSQYTITVAEGGFDERMGIM